MKSILFYTEIWINKKKKEKNSGVENMPKIP